MNSKLRISLISILLPFAIYSQKVSAVYKIDDLVKKMAVTGDTTYIVNFWATWCKPCVQELPEFQKMHEKYAGKNVKVLMVTLDFRDQLEKKVNPFLLKNNYSFECVLLDEVNGNDFIDKIDPTWSGAIPATLIVNPGKEYRKFLEKKVNLELLESLLP